MGRRLVGLGLLSLACYIGVHYLVPLAPHHAAHPTAQISMDWLPWRALAAVPAPSGGQVVLLGLAAAFVLLAAYLAALRLAWHAAATPSALRVVVGFSLLFLMAAAFAPPQSSSDLFGYINYARVLGVHGANPYEVPPIAFEPDPWLPLAGPGWMEVTTPYGPVWMLLSAALARLGGASHHVTLLLFRLTLAAANVACLGLIAYILKRHQPAHLLPGLLFYAWNPIVALKGASHNEPVMVFFMLLAVALLQARRRWLGLAAINLSVLTKFVTAPLALLYGWRLLRGARPWTLVVGGALLAGLALLGLYLFGQQDIALVRLLRRMVVPATDQGPSARSLLAGVAVVAALAWAAWQDRGGLAHLLAGWVAVLYCLLLFFPSSSYSWHMITLAAAASLVRRPGLVVLAAGLIASAHANNVLVTVIDPVRLVPVSVFRLVRWGVPLALWAALLGRGVLAGVRHAPGRTSAAPAEVDEGLA